MFKSLEVKYPKFYQVFRFIIVIIASVLYAWNLRCFAKVADLLPGGFSGVSLLFQAIGLRFFYISIPFTIFNVALNIFPAYIAYRYIGRKFTIYSIVVIILSSVLVDILPPYIFTEDILLISVFGGIINGFAISLCLNVGTTTGGTDFISIYFSHVKGIDAWNYILLGNVVILLIAGGLFGWSIALYSIIYQFCSTQVIQFMYKRYQKMTLFIISDKSEEIYHAIKNTTNHDATLFKCRQRDMRLFFQDRSVYAVLFFQQAISAIACELRFEEKNAFRKAVLSDDICYLSLCDSAPFQNFLCYAVIGAVYFRKQFHS